MQEQASCIYTVLVEEFGQRGVANWLADRTSRPDIECHFIKMRDDARSIYEQQGVAWRNAPMRPAVVAATKSISSSSSRRCCSE